MVTSTDAGGDSTNARVDKLLAQNERRRRMSATQDHRDKEEASSAPSSGARCCAKWSNLGVMIALIVWQVRVLSLYAVNRPSFMWDGKHIEFFEIGCDRIFVVLQKSLFLTCLITSIELVIFVVSMMSRGRECWVFMACAECIGIVANGAKLCVSAWGLVTLLKFDRSACDECLVLYRCAWWIFVIFFLFGAGICCCCFLVFRFSSSRKGGDEEEAPLQSRAALGDAEGPTSYQSA